MIYREWCLIDSYWEDTSLSSLDFRQCLNVSTQCVLGSQFQACGPVTETVLEPTDDDTHD